MRNPSRADFAAIQFMYDTVDRYYTHTFSEVAVNEISLFSLMRPSTYATLKFSTPFIDSCINENEFTYAA